MGRARCWLAFSLAGTLEGLAFSLITSFSPRHVSSSGLVWSGPAPCVLTHPHGHSRHSSTPDLKCTRGDM